MSAASMAGARADTAAAVHAYLAAVYPAALDVLASLGPRQLIRRFDALDYFYSCSAAALSSLQPPMDSAHKKFLCSTAGLPYIPHGAYYRANGALPLDSGRLNVVLWSSFDRHLRPVHVLRDATSAVGFHSSFGARVGPQPSWTSPLAIVRYVHHPSGLLVENPESPTTASGAQRKAALKAHGSSPANGMAHPFTVANGTRFSAWKQLRDGDAVEIEQWGGLLNAEECPPICGLWANVWHGTGVMLRVRRPFVVHELYEVLHLHGQIVPLIEQRRANGYAPRR